MGKPKDNKTVLTGNQQVQEFVGVVQFLKGKANWDGTDRKDDIGFKTLFGWNESVAVDDDAHLKMVTRSRCVAVVYGESQLQTPLKSAESAWNVVGGSARWICGTGQSDTVRLNGHAISLSDGELLYHKKLLYIVHGKAVSESGELEPGQTYKWSGNRWIVEYDGEDLYQSWELAQKLPAPKESKSLGEPSRKIRSRWYLGPMFGPAKTSHPNSLFEISDPEIHGIRAAVNFKWGDQSVIGSLNFYEIENKNSERDCCSMGPPQPGDDPTRHNLYESFTADVGWRSNHDRDWAWTARMGIGLDILEVRSFSSGPGPGFSFQRDVDFISAHLSFGIEKIFFEEWLGWGGLLLSAEAFYHQGLIHQKTNSEPFEYIPDPRPPEYHSVDDTLSAFGVIFNFAPLLQF